MISAVMGRCGRAQHRANAEAMAVDLTPTARIPLLAEDATLRRELLPWFVQAAAHCHTERRALGTSMRQALLPLNLPVNHGP